MQTSDLRDDIDFGSGDIPRLFRKMFFPTLLGMLFTAMYIITDGIFVGRGLGSDALAAINIVAPIFMVAAGIGLMAGMGGSVLASIHLANGKPKVARLCITQASVSLIALQILATTGMLHWLEPIVRLLGSSERLLPLCVEYCYGFVPFLAIFILMNSLSFYVRLSGAPSFAMRCTILGTLINIMLDYLLIFIFEWGIFGAALASGVGTTVSVTLLVWYLSKRSHTIHFEPIKFSNKSIRMALRNVWYMARLGVSSLLSECALAMMFICGNYVFMNYMGEDGVAAFSVCCYIFPMVFMLNTSVAQSAQPIISYNHGAGDKRRVVEGLKVSLMWGVGVAIVVNLVSLICANGIVGLFISEGQDAYQIATLGLPLFAVGFLPFAINIIVIGYYQSIERVARAMTATVLRGFVFMLISFSFMPEAFGDIGVWLAIPIGEVATMIYLLAGAIYDKKRDNSTK